jgi:anti-sigma B factor antagonist
VKGCGLEEFGARIPGEEPVMTDLDVAIRESAGKAVLEVQGDVDIATCQTLERGMKQLERSACSQLMIDISQVHYLDSTGVSLFLQGVTLPDGRHFRVIGAPPRIQRLFRILRIDSILEDKDEHSQCIGA